MKIQSVSDIITNSSSEVFIVNDKYAESISSKTSMPYDLIDLDYLKDHLDLVAIICELAGIESPEFADETTEEWYECCMLSFIDNHINEINGYLSKGRALICNGNCFYKNEQILQEIREKSEWSDFQ